MSRTYITAVRLGHPTRDALRNEGLTDEEIDDLTAELVARELLVAGPDPDSWAVAPPREAMTRVADRVERRAAMSRATASEVEQLWRAALGDGRVLEPPGMDLLKGVDDIVDRARGLHRVAEERLWWMLDASKASCALLEGAVKDPRLLSIRPGVDVRVVLDTALLSEATAVPFMERHLADGHSVRVGHGLPFSLLLCDTRAALLDLSRHDPDGDGSLEARRSGPLSGIESLLEQIWALSTPFAAASRAAQDPARRTPLDERDQRVLDLLTAGASDQLIARQMSVSVRTVERRVRYLMEHLGAGTRFQAGVQAVRRGWV